MGKSFDEITNRIQGHLILKPEDQDKILKSLEESLKGMGEEKKSNAKSVEAVEGQVEGAKAKFQFIKKDRSECHEKRQRAIAFDQDPTAITVKLKKLRDEEEFLEDTVAGLEMKLKDLLNEGELLEKEETEIQWLINFFSIVPLVRQYNELAPKMASVLEELYLKIWETPDIPRFISASTHDWIEGLWIIPRLSFAGDDPHEMKCHHFDGRGLKEDYVRQTQLKLKKSQAT